MTTIFETIINSYTELMSQYNESRIKLDKKIDTLNKRIVRLEKRKNALKFPYWTERLLRPVLNEIKKHFPEYSCDDERLSPMGLGCRVSLFFCKTDLPDGSDRWQEGNSIYITFLPGSLDKGELLYETGAANDKFRPDTIGAINGFNQVTKMLESVEEAVAFLRQQEANAQQP